MRSLIDDLINDTDLIQGYGMGPPSPCPDLRGKNDTAAVKLMVEWFLANFEDPAENTPRDGGGYVYIWGDPSTAEEELVNAFDGIATEKAIAAAVEEIEEHGCDWVPSQSRMEPEEPDDAVVVAKQRLFAVIETWLSDNFGADPDRNRAQFRIADVVLLLHEHHRLRKIEDRVRAALTPAPASFKFQEQSYER
jgi:hypothetical protein